MTAPTLDELRRLRCELAPSKLAVSTAVKALLDCRKVWGPVERRKCPACGKRCDLYRAAAQPKSPAAAEGSA